MLEVQTPYMSAELAESLLGEPDNKPEKKIAAVKVTEKAEDQKLDPSQTE